MSTQPHILVVDDDDRLRSLIAKFLRENNYQVNTAASAKEARELMRIFTFNALVLDIMMPGETGLEFAASFNGHGRPPILMLSALSETQDRINGLEVGADDYLTKPFEPKELLLRLQAILRRSTAPVAKSISACAFGDFRFDFDTNTLKKNGEIVHLTSAETQMLRIFAERVGKTISREELANLMSQSSERSIDVQVTRLRKKIETTERPIYLQTLRGAGYALYGQSE